VYPERVPAMTISTFRRTHFAGTRVLEFENLM